MAVSRIPYTVRRAEYAFFDAVAAGAEKFTTLCERADNFAAGEEEVLSQRISRVLLMQIASRLGEWESLQEGERKAALWADILQSLVVLRRGDLHFERLESERERFELRRFRSEAEMRESFFAWMQRGENVRLVKERVAEIEGAVRKQRVSRAEIRRRVRAKLGVP